VLRPDGPVLVRQAFPDHLDAVTLYRRYFPGVARIAAGLAALERAAAAETSPAR
jgi:hypothetical protein